MILIASPHLDDEVLGCASFLGAGPAGEPFGEDVAIVYACTTHPEFASEIGFEHAAFIAAVRRMYSGRVNPYYLRREASAINHLDIVPQAILIAEYERIINEIKPSTVLVPAPSYNQDHRAVYDAMLTACRPHDRNWYVKRVLAYEEPETFGALRQPPAFRPTYFRSLNIMRKLELYQVYVSQVRGHRSSWHLSSIASVRGMQAGVEYAEAFEVLRWVE